MKAENMTSEEKRDAIAAAADDKKANYLTELDLRGKTLIADFFIICSGTSNIHIRAVADGIIEALEKRGVRQRRIEGYSEATWVLLDYGDVIVHIMSEDQRSFYKLENLWTKEVAPQSGSEWAIIETPERDPDAEDMEDVDDLEFAEHMEDIKDDVEPAA